MPVREIKKGDNPCLKANCAEVTEFNDDLKQLIQDMKESMLKITA